MTTDTKDCGYCNDGWPLIPNGIELHGFPVHAVPEPQCNVPCAKGYDFIINDPIAKDALETYGRAIADAELQCGIVLTDVCGMPPEHAITAMINRLVHRAATAACLAAVHYFNRDPDPERWHQVTDAAFRRVVYVLQNPPAKAEGDDAKPAGE